MALTKHDAISGLDWKEIAFEQSLKPYALCTQFSRLRSVNIIKKSLCKKIPDFEFTNKHLTLLTELISFLLNKLRLELCVQVYFVGSFVDYINSNFVNQSFSDIDLLLTLKNKDEMLILWQEIEMFLWSIRWIGRHFLFIKIDPFLSFDNHLKNGGVLNKKDVLNTWLIEYPSVKQQIGLPSILSYQRIGFVSIIIKKMAQDTTYFCKLPTDNNGNKILRKWVLSC